MPSQPIVPLNKDQMERLTRSDLISHVEALYRRQDDFEDHELFLRNRYKGCLLPAKEDPIARLEDKELQVRDLGEVMDFTLRLQVRLEEYVVVFHDVHMAGSNHKIRKQIARRVPEKTAEEQKAYKKIINRNRTLRKHGLLCQ